MESPEYSLQQLTSRAESYCARAEHCASEVRTKILAWGGSKEDADKIVAHLYAQKYLDDARYCNAYVHDKLLYQHWGKVKIRTMLQARQLPTSYIQNALKNIDETEYNRILRAVLSLKKNATREAQIRFLLQRGFEYRDIRKVVQYEE